MRKIRAMKHELDIRGQVCPVALFRSLRTVNDLQAALSSGEASLEILTDNRDSVPTISAALRNMGYSVTVAGNDSYYTLRVDGGNSVGEAGGER